MNNKTIAVLSLLTLVMLIGIPESFAYPQYGSSCSNCHSTAQNGLGNQMGISTADGNNNVVLTQGNTQTGDTPRQEMNPMKYTLGVIGTGLVVISQFYSLRKRRR
jgi:hypothetical protein